MFRKQNLWQGEALFEVQAAVCRGSLIYVNAASFLYVGMKLAPTNSNRLIIQTTDLTIINNRMSFAWGVLVRSL